MKTVGARDEQTWSFKIDATTSSVTGRRGGGAWDLELEARTSGVFVDAFGALGGTRASARDLALANGLDYSALLRSDSRYWYASPTISSTDSITLWQQPVLSDPRFEELERGTITLTTAEVEATLACLADDHPDTAEPWRDDAIRSGTQDLRHALERWLARAVPVLVRED